MRYLLLILFLTSAAASAQTTEYVCPPCGRSCDSEVHTKPGTCASCRMTLVKKSSVAFESLSAAEFCAHIAGNPKVVILDVRSKGEFDDSAWGNTYGHFKNAININIDELEKRLGELEKYKDREILVYCSHSVRSPRAAILLTEHGFRNVANLAGGVSTLNSEGDECLSRHFVVH